MDVYEEIPLTDFVPEPEPASEVFSKSAPEPEYTREMTVSENIHSASSHNQRMQFYKKRSTISHMDGASVNVVQYSPTDQPPPRRQKSQSVCVAMPEANKDRYDELQKRLDNMESTEPNSLRVPSLSVSEVFHADDTVNTYRPARPPPLTHFRKPRKETCLGYIIYRKHTFCAWTFGISVVIVMAIIIGIQLKENFFG